MAKNNGKKVTSKMQTPEQLVAGLRRRGGHLPTKVSEAARKKKIQGIHDY